MLLIVSAFCCNSPEEKEFKGDVSQKNWAPEPAIFYTSLADSLSQKAMITLQLGEVTGIKVKYLDGHENRYFKYIAEKQSVIRAISQLPFTKYSDLSDTHCRRIPYQELMRSRPTISATEYEHSTFFWDAAPETIEVYECIKSPFKHTLLIDPKSNHVMHRVELVG